MSDTAAYEQGYQDGAMAKDAEIEGLRERVRIADSLVSEKSVELALELSIANTRLAEAESIITGLYVVPECRAYYDKYIKEKQP